MASFFSLLPAPLSASPPSAKMTRIPTAALGSTPRNTRLPYRLKEGQSRLFHQLSSGLSMEAIVQRPAPEAEGRRNPALVFVHGSFHAAWCWAENWLPFFSAAGYDCYAVSLLGQGESDVPTGAAAGTLQAHTSDIAEFIQKEVSLPPVLIGHSFGGLIVQSYISNMINGCSVNQSSSSVRENAHPRLAGAVLLCSVPPSGNSGLVWRYLMTKPVAAFLVTLSLAAKAFSYSLPLCKKTFFSTTMEDHQILRYQQLMKESSQLPLFDLRKLNASLPVSSIPKNSMEIFVVGASNDFIVDAEGLRETAEFYHVQPVCVDGVGHDMMLDSSWKNSAKIILSWLESLSR